MNILPPGSIFIYQGFLIRFYFNLIRIDASGDGNIDFEEFVEVMSKKVNATYTADQVKHAFRYDISSLNQAFLYTLLIVFLC